MDKRQDRGYTLISVLIMMLVLSICTLGGSISFRHSYESYALRSGLELSASYLLRAKYESYVLLDTRKVCFLENHISFQNEEQSYPRGVSNATPVCFTYNENGNVLKGGTLHLHTRNYQRAIVVEIGGGFFEMRK